MNEYTDTEIEPLVQTRSYVMSGIKHGGQRPKRSKNVRGSATEKKFRKNDDETQARYAEKLQRRAKRKTERAKKRRK